MSTGFTRADATPTQSDTDAWEIVLRSPSSSGETRAGPKEWLAMNTRNPLLQSVTSAERSLADILERVLDQGMIVAGDISINLVGIELLTTKVRLLLASVEGANEMGVDWWRQDSFFSGHAPAIETEPHRQQDGVQQLENQAPSAASTGDTDATTGEGRRHD
jgi:hypothetical protein